LARVLTETGAGEDEQAVAAAQRVMAERDPAGSQAGKYQIDARWGRGQQFGDHNTQHNQF
jgi:hypothetical protein